MEDEEIDQTDGGRVASRAPILLLTEKKIQGEDEWILSFFLFFVAKEKNYRLSLCLIFRQ
jgi:hypothetical protein